MTLCCGGVSNGKVGQILQSVIFIWITYLVVQPHTFTNALERPKQNSFFFPICCHMKRNSTNSFTLFSAYSKIDDECFARDSPSLVVGRSVAYMDCENIIFFTPGNVPNIGSPTHFIRPAQLHLFFFEAKKDVTELFLLPILWPIYNLTALLIRILYVLHSLTRN